MEKSLAFYRDLLGLEEERNQILEGELADQLVGYKDAKLHVIYLSNGDMRHASRAGDTTSTRPAIPCTRPNATR